MLWARGTFEVDGCGFASTTGIERALRVHAIERRGLAWDTRFAPTKRASGPEHPLIYVLLDGRTEWTAKETFVQRPGTIVIASERCLDRATAESGLRSDGEPFRALELFIDGAHVPRWTGALEALAASDSLRKLAEDVFAAGSDWTAATPATIALLEALADADIVARGLVDTVVRAEAPTLLRCWNALAEHYLRVAPAPSLQDLADGAGLSVRQVTRDLGMLLETFFLGANRYRDAVSDTRLRLAVLLLSAGQITIAEIAKSAGYGSIQALGRAFRDADLPPPSTVRRALETTTEK